MKIFTYNILNFNIFVLLCRSSSKVEEACEMYTRAANMFKMAKKWSGELSVLNVNNNLNK